MRNIETHTIKLSARPKPPVRGAGAPVVLRGTLRSREVRARHSFGPTQSDPISVRGSRISPLRKIFALLLVSVMVSNPILVVYAEGEASLNETALKETIVSQESDVSDSVADDVSSEEVSTESEIVTPVEDAGTVVVEDVAHDAATESVEEESVQGTTPADTENQEEGVLEEVVETTEQEIQETEESEVVEEVLEESDPSDEELALDVTPEDEGENVNTETNQAEEEVVANEDSTESEAVVSGSEEVAQEEPSSASSTVIVGRVREEINDQNRYLFSKQQCIKMEDGYYCTEKEAAAADDMAAKEGEVFVASDSDGDKEIYLIQSGASRQITANAEDDDMPYYDRATGVVVWQTLVNDRYQIMAFNTITGEERKVTDTPHNNTNPHLFGTTLVWQSWIGNNWEIMMFDLSHADMSAIQVTNNTWDDMFPQARDEFVTWQAFFGGKWQVFVYDGKNGTTVQLGEGDGQFENPRFMLIIDNKGEDGNVTTVGYDTRTGELIPFGAAQNVPPTQSVPESPSQEQNEAVPVESGQIHMKTQRDNDADGGDGNGNGDDDPDLSSDSDAVVATSSQNTLISDAGSGDVVPSSTPSVPDGVIVLKPVASSSDPIAPDVPPLVLSDIASSSDSSL